MADMLGLMLKGMGVDPAALFQQAAAMGETFQRLATLQEAIGAKLDTVLANQAAIMAAMGLVVPAPEGDVLALIDEGSRKFLIAPETIQ
jgi:hypothetical protein